MGTVWMLMTDHPYNPDYRGKVDSDAPQADPSAVSCRMDTLGKGDRTVFTKLSGAKMEVRTDSEEQDPMTP